MSERFTSEHPQLRDAGLRRVSFSRAKFYFPDEIEGPEDKVWYLISWQSSNCSGSITPAIIRIYKS